jgi:NADH-quinone oxidoreductase subunit L
LVERISCPLFTKAATEEHHFGTSEYHVNASCRYRWISWNKFYAKYIKQNQVPAEDAAITGLQKCYTINIM